MPELGRKVIRRQGRVILLCVTLFQLEETVLVLARFATIVRQERSHCAHAVLLVLVLRFCRM